MRLQLRGLTLALSSVKPYTLLRTLMRVHYLAPEIRPRLRRARFLMCALSQGPCE